LDVFLEDQNACKAAWADHVMEKFALQDWAISTEALSETRNNLKELGRDCLGNKTYTED